MKEKLLVLSDSLCASIMLNTEDKMAPSLLELIESAKPFPVTTLNPETLAPLSFLNSRQSPIAFRCRLKKNAQNYSCGFWGKMRTIAKETAFQVTLRNCR